MDVYKNSKKVNKLVRKLAQKKADELGALPVQFVAYVHGQWWVELMFDPNRFDYETKHFSLVDTSDGPNLEEL